MSAHKLVIKDALWQLFGRVISALFGFVITKIIASYLGPLRYGDYGTIFKFFARWTALVDFGIYVLAVKKLWQLKSEAYGDKEPETMPNENSPLAISYGKFVGTRVFLIWIIYTLAIIVAYLIPAYTSNPFIIRGLPLAMCYSASNMFAGIQQLPLQIFRKMKRLTRSLIIARLSQLLVLLPVVFLFFKDINFITPGETSETVLTIAFCLIIFSVVASSIGQNIEIHLRTKDLLPLKIRFDFPFIKKLFKSNRKYGFSYFFSSFHTLLVLMFLGRFFPTSEGYREAGVWALALSLIEILLIIPSSLGNSLLHKIPGYSEENKKKSLWHLLALISWIGGFIALNFWIFAPYIIPIVSSKKFLGSRAYIETRGSDQILPFLWIVLLLSFIKQVYNYCFVALEKHNKLFAINLSGVTIGALIWIFLIPKYGLLGGVITQILIEVIFTGGALFVAWKNKLSPHFPRSKSAPAFIALLTFGGLGILLKARLPEPLPIWQFFLIAGIFNLLLVGLVLFPMKKIAAGLTQENK